MVLRAFIVTHLINAGLRALFLLRAFKGGGGFRWYLCLRAQRPRINSRPLLPVAPHPG